MLIAQVAQQMKRLPDQLIHRTECWKPFLSALPLHGPIEPLIPYLRINPLWIIDRDAQLYGPALLRPVLAIQRRSLYAGKLKFKRAC